jgi:predicted metal-dependent hydrolase
MTTEARFLRVGELRVSLVRKAIKNLHLGVYPPDGRVRVAAPLAVSDAAVHAAVVGRLAWIKRQQKAFLRQPRETAREMVSGESHYYRGRRYRLRVEKADGRPSVEARDKMVLLMRVRPRATASDRERVLYAWYRDRMREAVDKLLPKWQRRCGVETRFVGIRRMKTKWGSCSASTGRIWLNVELIKKPPSSLEYVMVHELVHLLERSHGGRFVKFMDEFIPNWRSRRSELIEWPLRHEAWRC